MMMDELPVFVHTEGLDCPCNPDQTPVGVCHHGGLDRIDEITDSGDGRPSPLPIIGR